MIGTELLRLIGQAVTAGGRAITPADPVDQHAAEVTRQLGLRANEKARVGRPRLLRAPDDPIHTRLEVTAQQLRERNRQYGRASAKIGAQRDRIARLRLQLAHANTVGQGEREHELMPLSARAMICAALDMPAESTTGAIVVAIQALRDSRERDAAKDRHPAGRGLPDQLSPIGRRAIVDALGLPADSTSSAIVVAIRGLREAAESVVEVDADQVSLPVAAAVESRELIDKNAVAAEVLRRDNERLRKIEHAAADYVNAVDRGRALGLKDLGRPVLHFQPLRAALAIGPFIGDDETSGPEGSGSGRDETGPHARGPVSVPGWSSAERFALARAICAGDNKTDPDSNHVPWDELADLGRQTYLALAGYLLSDGWRHLDVIETILDRPAHAESGEPE